MNGAQPTGWSVVPQGAVPLRELMFAHEEIVEAVISTLGMDGGGSFAEKRIRRDKDHWAEAWTPEGHTFWQYGDQIAEADGEWSSEVIGTKHSNHWDVEGPAWPTAIAVFDRLVRTGALRLVGRYGDARALGEAIPSDALIANIWATPRVRFNLGQIDLLTRQTVFSVHIFREFVEPDSIDQKMAAKRSLLVAIAASPLRKTLTSKQFVEEWTPKIGSVKGAEKVWNRTRSEIKDPHSKAAWAQRGPVRN